MSDQLSEIKDMIAVVAADIEQAQAKLDHARLRFANPEPWFQTVMDEAQARLESQREQLKGLRAVARVLED